jgi:sialic acid synthase SpsE
MIKIIQEIGRASEDVIKALMSAAVRAGAEVILIQETSMRKEENEWKAKIRDANYAYIFSNGNEQLYILTAVRMDIKWEDYGCSRTLEKVGIEIGKTRITNIYHHRKITQCGKYYA